MLVSEQLFLVYFHMPDISQIVLDGKTITVKQNVRFQERMHPEIF